MNPTRRTQPYRQSGSRAPSAVLTAMRSGRSQPMQAPALTSALRGARKRTKRGKGVIPAGDPRILAAEAGIPWTPTLTIPQP